MAKGRSLHEMMKDCVNPYKGFSAEDGKKWRESARGRLREWLRLKADAMKETAKVIATQRGMTTKQIQTARKDWVRFGRKVTWAQFLQTRRVELDKIGKLMIHGASRA